MVDMIRTTPQGTKQVPTIISYLLKLLHEHIDKNAIVAGGYLRDLMVHKMEGKDIDAFVYGGGLLGPDGIGQKLNAFVKASGITDIKIHSFQKQSVLEHWDTLMLLKCKFQDRDVDLMFINKPIDEYWYPKRVNFGINQIWCDGYRIYTADAFKEDFESKTITLIHSASRRELERNLKKQNLLHLRPEWQGWSLACAFTEADLLALPTGEIPDDS